VRRPAVAAAGHLMVWAHGEAAAYAHLRDRYLDVARTLGYEGHIAGAQTVP
jgi:hypothetical protein